MTQMDEAVIVARIGKVTGGLRMKWFVVFFLLSGNQEQALINTDRGGFDSRAACEASVDIPKEGRTLDHGRDIVYRWICAGNSQVARAQRLGVMEQD